MPVSTSQKWPAPESRWHSIEDLVLLLHLSLLEADLSPCFTVTSRAAENGELPSLRIIAGIPGYKTIELALVGQPSAQVYVVTRVPRFRSAVITKLQEKSLSVRRADRARPKKSSASLKKLLAHGHREGSAGLETYLKRRYVDVGSELLGTTDLTRLEGSLRSCARREGRYLRETRTQKGSITFTCWSGASCPFRVQFEAPVTPSRRVEWKCTRLCARHSCRPVDTPLLIVINAQMRFFPKIELGTPEALRAPAPQAAPSAANRQVKKVQFIKDEEGKEEDGREPVEEVEELAAEPAAQEPDSRSSLKRRTEATQESNPARSAKKATALPKSQRKEARRGATVTDSTGGAFRGSAAVTTTLPSRSVFDASGSTGSNVPAVIQAQAALVQSSASTIKCLLPSTANQARPHAIVQPPMRRATVKFARTEVLSTANGRFTTVSIKGDFLGVWVPKYQ